jgi:hypothetical protein
MTEEQIKQIAEAYADSMIEIRGELEWCATRDDFIAGAHSRDEEIEELELSLEAAADVVKILTKQSNELRNPWISVEKRLPAPRKDTCFSENCLVLYKDQEIGISYITEAYYDFGYKGNGGWVLTFNDNEHFFYSDYQENGCIVTHWMPIPELEKGE